MSNIVNILLRKAFTSLVIPEYPTAGITLKTNPISHRALRHWHTERERQIRKPKGLSVAKGGCALQQGQKDQRQSTKELSINKIN